MRKCTIPREEIIDNKGNVVMRKTKRIMALARIKEVKSNLIELLIETLEESTEDEVA